MEKDKDGDKKFGATFVVIKRKEDLPKGAIEIHFGSYENVLRPRGSMKKESLGGYIAGYLTGEFKHWTDSRYGDNPKVEALIEKLRFNLDSEVKAAWQEFIQGVRKEEKK